MAEAAPRPSRPPGSDLPSQRAEPAAGARRELLFRLLAVILVPVLVLVAAEAVLRLAGLGFRASFLMPGVETPQGEERWVTNPRFGWRFFPRSLARRPEMGEVVREPPPGSMRVVLLGGSAAMGIPEPAFGMARMLEVMLGEALPGHRIQVLNAAMTAINSHVVLTIAEDLLEQRPDALVVYLGNNEVVGPWGAGSVFGSHATPRPLIRAGIRLRALRVGQLLDAGLGRAAGPGRPTGWQGMAHFTEHRVAAADPELERVYAHFEANLTQLLRRARSAEVPVLVSTVGVDLFDTPPFAASPPEGLSAAEAEAFSRSIAAVARATVARAGAGARLDALAPASRLDRDHAEVAYLEGRARLEQGLVEEGRARLEQARDADTLRFRADTRIGEILRRVAASPGAILVDAERRLKEASARGAPGSDLFWEHVHLRPEGNRIVAEAILEALLPLVESGSAEPGPPSLSGISSLGLVRQQLGLTPWHELRMARDIVDM
ncbi:MAG: hypothetical protein MI919_05130, partial [Holophagales bacterium]|nr:hypothetical protein [Holophagales bacterium]